MKRPQQGRVNVHTTISTCSESVSHLEPLGTSVRHIVTAHHAPFVIRSVGGSFLRATPTYLQPKKISGIGVNKQRTSVFFKIDLARWFLILLRGPQKNSHLDVLLLYWAGW